MGSEWSQGFKIGRVREDASCVGRKEIERFLLLAGIAKLVRLKFGVLATVWGSLPEHGAATEEGMGPH